MPPIRSHSTLMVRMSDCTTFAIRLLSFGMLPREISHELQRMSTDQK